MKKDQQPLSRRQFLRTFGATTGAGLLAACGATTPTTEQSTATTQPTPADTDTPAATVVSDTTATNAPTDISTIAPTRKVDLSPTPAAAPEQGLTSTHASEIDFSKTENGEVPSGLFNPREGVSDGHEPEAQTYTNRSENVRIENDVLVIQARKEHFGTGKDEKDYTSAWIDTQGIFDFQYGTLEVTAQLPHGAGTWPAIWMLASENVREGNPQPVTEDFSDPLVWQQRGEIDIAEVQGIEGRQGTSVIRTDIHTYDTLKNHDGSDEGITKVKDAEDGFHTYGVIWTPDSITFTIDGSPTKTITKKDDNPAKWPFNEGRFYLVLNLAMGGTWAEELAQGSNLPNGIDDSQEDRWKFLIKNITYSPLDAIK